MILLVFNINDNSDSKRVWYIEMDIEKGQALSVVIIWDRRYVKLSNERKSGTRTRKCTSDWMVQYMRRMKQSGRKMAVMKYDLHYA